MRGHKMLVTVLAAVVALGMSACGGTTPEAAEPEPEAAAGEEAEETEEDAAARQKEAAEKAEAEAKKKSPEDFITEPETYFAYSYPDSDAGQKKTEECAKKAKDDPAKKAECMSKALKQVDEDGIQFRKDDKGSWWFITMGKQAGKAVILHSIEFEVKEQTENTIVLTLKGRDRGKKPMAAVPKEIVIEVPNDYEITYTDPRAGKKVYKARVNTQAREEPKTE